MKNINYLIYNYIIYILFAIFLGCQAKTKSQVNDEINTIISNEDIYTVSIDGDIAIFCTGTKKEGNSKRIYYKELGESDPVLFYEVDNFQKNIMPARLSNNQMFWIEYFQDNFMIKWELCCNNISKSDKKRIIINNVNNPKVEPPHFDVFEEFVVFDYFIPSGSDSINSSIFLFDTKKKSLTEIKAPKGYDLYIPSFNGADKNEIVCNLLSSDIDGRINSKIAIYQIDSKKWTIIPITNTGFQPSLYKRKLVFKECNSPFEYGTIQLYDIETEQLQTLFTDSLGGELPQINSTLVVWESPYFDKIPAYNYTTNKHIVIEEGTTGKPFLKGNSLIWVAEKEQDKPVIHAKKVAPSI